MATGFAVPMRVSPNGGILLESSDAHASSVLQVALGDCDSKNPFQYKIGLGVDMVFSQSDPASRPLILSRLFALFDSFERKKRFKLLKSTIVWSEGADGEMVIDFKYVNLESDEVTNFRRSLLSNGRSIAGSV